jgi:hypothetical protein
MTYEINVTREAMIEILINAIKAGYEYGYQGGQDIDEEAKRAATLIAHTLDKMSGEFYQ